MGKESSKLRKVETPGTDQDAKPIRGTSVEAADSPEEIKEQIEHTRQQMEETIDEIQNRLSVENITEQVKETASEQLSEAWDSTKKTVYEATRNKTGEIMELVNNGIHELSDTKVIKTARRNPLALSLIGAGLGVLLYNAYSSGSSERRNRFDEPRRLNAAGTAGIGTDPTGSKSEGVYDKITDTAGNAYESVTETASHAYESTASAVSKAYSKVGQAGTQVRETASDLGHRAYEQYDHHIEEHPLAVGAVALAVGAAVGMAIPSTRYEAELIGDKRDELLDKASQKVSGFVDEKVSQVKAVASETADTAIEEARKAAGNTVETAKDQARDKNLVPGQTGNNS